MILEGEIVVQQEAWKNACRDAERYRIARLKRLVDLRDEEEIDYEIKKKRSQPQSRSSTDG